jgi:hypothetical protein
VRESLQLEVGVEVQQRCFQRQSINRGRAIQCLPTFAADREQAAPHKACHPGAIERRWTQERVLDAMRDWFGRYGWLPTSYDWSRTHAQRRGGEALAASPKESLPKPGLPRAP